MHYAETVMSLAAALQGCANARNPTVSCESDCHLIPSHQALLIIVTPLVLHPNYKNLDEPSYIPKQKPPPDTHTFTVFFYNPAAKGYIEIPFLLHSKNQKSSAKMAVSGYSSGTATWQERLEEACREAQIHPPVFQIVSDRRGGRTAWSSTVTVHGQNIAARYWYDGQYVNNAKEDAAEVALKHLSGSSPSSPSQSRSGW